MSEEIRYIDRETREEKIEHVYGKYFIHALYGNTLSARLFSPLFRPLFAHFSCLSRLYAFFQKKSWSKRKIAPFIKKFNIDTSEFLKPLGFFSSFNDFFIRKLKPESRPLALGTDVAILPADGRYLIYPNIEIADGFFIKGAKFSLDRLIEDPELAKKYKQGGLVIARLAPVDYHRFHFPMNCKPDKPRLFPGPLYSVNPIALKKDIDILSKNKRMLTVLQTKNFGNVAFLEIGATHVGSIHQTFIPHEPYAKGDEKGYFSFGGSCLVLLFEPGVIQFDQDLVDNSQKKIETLGKLGQSLGRALRPL